MAKFKKEFESHSRVYMPTTEVDGLPLPSLTEQQYKNECDLNLLIKAYQKSGVPLPAPVMNCMDCTTVMQFETAKQVIADAESSFECLPSNIRDEFKTVQNYLQYISDEKNIKDVYERGLADVNSIPLDKVYPERYQILPDPVKTDVVEPATGLKSDVVSDSKT